MIKGISALELLQRETTSTNRIKTLCSSLDKMLCTFEIKYFFWFVFILHKAEALSLVKELLNYVVFREVVKHYFANYWL